MTEKTLIIENRLGLHARPAALFVQMAAQFSSNVFLIKDGFEVNGKSILSVLMLAAEKGSEITIKTDGKDENDAMEMLGGFLQGAMDEYKET
jgi:phosphocarrier protein HPr